MNKSQPRKIVRQRAAVAAPTRLNQWALKICELSLRYRQQQSIVPAKCN